MMILFVLFIHGVMAIGCTAMTNDLAEHHLPQSILMGLWNGDIWVEGRQYQLLIDIKAPCGNIDTDRSDINLVYIVPDETFPVWLIEEPLRGTCDATDEQLSCDLEFTFVVEDEDSGETNEFVITGTCTGDIGEEAATCSTAIPGLDLEEVDMVTTYGELRIYDIDADNDGYGLCVDDCDDRDDSVYPGNGC